MKNWTYYLLKFVVGISFILILSNCTIVEMIATGKGNRMGAGAPELNEGGKFADTLYNRQFFEERVDASINREKNNLLPGHDWQRGWRVSFRAINQTSANPKHEKNYIIAKRKEAGLPIWPFMLK